MSRREHDRDLQPLEGRPPPMDPGAEDAVIAGAILWPDRLDELDFLQEDHFVSQGRRLLWRAVLALRLEGVAITAVSLASWLIQQDLLAGAGGASEIAALLARSDEPSLLVRHARRVRDCARERQLILTLQTHAATGYVAHGTTEEWMVQVEREVSAITEDAGAAKATTLNQLCRQVYNETAENQRLKRAPGIPLGIAGLDEKLCVELKTATIIAGRPGMGKTSAALSMVLGAVKAPLQLFGERAAPAAAGIFSLEMSKKELAQRLMAAESGVPFSAIRAGTMSAPQWDRLARACNVLSALPVVIDDTAGVDIDAIRGRVRRFRVDLAKAARARGVPTAELRLIVVDHIGLVRVAAMMKASRRDQIGYITRTLKEVAKSEGVAILEVCQLNRNSESREKDHRPQISDLRDSGDVEQDADNIVFVYRPEYYGETMPPGEEGKAELVVGKQRNGPTGTTFARYHAPQMCFTTY